MLDKEKSLLKVEENSKLKVEKRDPSDRVIALAGNPNTGKSTVFNALTGLKQHTGNWPGKTVENAQGYYNFQDQGYILVDVPGSYSLIARSAEEEVARDFICFGDPDVVVIVSDATSIIRNMNLVLQVIESGKKVIVCANLMDEANKRNIDLNLTLLSERLRVPVIGTAARSKQGLEDLQKAIQEAFNADQIPLDIVYPDFVEEGIKILQPLVKRQDIKQLDSRWLAARILDGDKSFKNSLQDYLNYDLTGKEQIKEGLAQYRKYLASCGKTENDVKDAIVESFIQYSILVTDDVVTEPDLPSDRRDRKLDKLFTSKATGFPIMLLILLLVFWITITGANFPSELLANLLFGFEDVLAKAAVAIGTPPFLIDMLIHGVYNVLAWVISVMLPPMAIFFPMFTLLEDFGYLPRVAFNLDKVFKSCQACGKQALTMCMGFGCNAAGVTGARIIDSPRERLIAIITNNFSPCNGRFPVLISVISIFLLGGTIGPLKSFLGALVLVLVLVFGIGMTFLSSKILSMTALKGVPSSFTLELPPYRKPQIGRVIVRSLFDRTIKVLGRAVTTAAPAGLIIWLLNNNSYGGSTLLTHLTNALSPIGHAMGMDGAILTGFILGLPANEIVMPIIIMIYLAQGTGLVELEGAALANLLVDNGWTWVTAISVLLFTVMHWPCGTTLLTIHKETQSWKWTFISFLVPTLSGIIICTLFNQLVQLFI